MISPQILIDNTIHHGISNTHNFGTLVTAIALSDLLHNSDQNTSTFTSNCASTSTSDYDNLEKYGESQSYEF
jgi:hypothetical protein